MDFVHNPYRCGPSGLACMIILEKYGNNIHAVKNSANLPIPDVICVNQPNINIYLISNYFGSQKLNGHAEILPLHTVTRLNSFQCCHIVIIRHIIVTTATW